MSVGSTNSNRAYFTDSAGTTSPKPIFFGVNNMVLDFCSQLVSGTTPTTPGNFDIMNFLWFSGPNIVYSNTACKLIVSSSYKTFFHVVVPNCLKAVILNDNQRSCLLCASGYYLYNTACYATCPTDTLAHEGTKSCQSKLTH